MGSQYDSREISASWEMFSLVNKRLWYFMWSYMKRDLAWRHSWWNRKMPGKISLSEHVLRKADRFASWKAWKSLAKYLFFLVTHYTYRKNISKRMHYWKMKLPLCLFLIFIKTLLFRLASFFWYESTSKENGECFSTKSCWRRRLPFVTMHLSHDTSCRLPFQQFFLEGF